MPPLAQEILMVLRPDTLGDIFTYAIMLFAIILLFVIPDGNDLPTYLQFGIILLCALDLFRGGNQFPIPGAENDGFFTFMLHIGMAVLPLIAAGAARKKGRQGGLVIPLAILQGLLGIVYALGSFASPDMFYAPGFI